MSEAQSVPGWAFSDDSGAFSLPDADRTSYLYFPLVNEAGIFSSVTPTLHGDIKSGHNTFLTPPVSVEDLHATRLGRAFWVYVEGLGAWCATGGSAAQTLGRLSNSPEPVTLKAGFLWQRVTRSSPVCGLQAEVTSFVPWSRDKAELMKVTLSNIGRLPLQLTPTAAIPIFGRSAENLRDHRHVTSLLQRTRCHPNGVLVQPSLSFDERGHQPNSITYAVLGAEGSGTPPEGFFPLLEDFTGEGGSLDWPAAVVGNLPAPCRSGDSRAGYESLGGLRFAPFSLAPGASKTFVLILAILEQDESPDRLVERYASQARCDQWLESTSQHWQAQLDGLRFHSRQARFDTWLRWVALQPGLRRLFGNSFLPYHDYGRGGRGWRDLWQDLLALLLMESSDVSSLLYSNFAGVRIDGSNATIIGSQPGEFKADRNNIPRVWMDHGAWPLLTVKLYIERSGDLAFLLRPQTYFKDHLAGRSTLVDEDWKPDQGTLQCMANGEPYGGSILEHLLIQHLSAFFNVGEHNIIRLEGADWNDGLDMARTRGESVAFSALYAGNLRILGELVLELRRLGEKEVQLAAELLPLLDSLSDPLDYASPSAKQARLAEYFAACRHTLSGGTVHLGLEELAGDLFNKARWLSEHIRRQEWVTDSHGCGWFNGYYDNDGQALEGERTGGVRMTLTGQVFTLLGGVASREQAEQMVQAAHRHLHDPAVGGYRLNTDFGEVLLNLGRCFGFAFGHKENGAMFSHMAVMYANALYRRGFARQGWQVLEEIYQHSQNFAISRMYPGIPEYFSARGRGMYPYLTGSASWYLLTLVCESFGIQGQLGDLRLAPCLVKEQFDARGEAAITTRFAGQALQVTYRNPGGLDCGEYAIRALRLNGDVVPLQPGRPPILPRQALAALPAGGQHYVEVELGGLE